MSKTKLIQTLALAGGLSLLALSASADPHKKDQRGYHGDRDAHGGVVLFTDAGFGGRSVAMNGAVPKLTEFGFNDRASSIVIRSGVWEVCTDANFRGRCEIIDRDVRRLKDYRLNDNISSVRPASRGWGRR